MLGPAHWLKKLMQLTWISLSFKLTILFLAVLYILCAWVFEKQVSQTLVKAFAHIRNAVSRKPKQRKAYKTILEKMRI